MSAPAAPLVSRSRSRPSALPAWLLLCAVAAASLLALGLLGEALAGGPGGPASSSYATDGQGLAAWAELLSRSGHPVVQLRTPLSRARLSPADTLVVLDPDALLADEGARLRAFVRAGGRLLLGGAHSQAALPAVLPRPPRLQSPASTLQSIPSGDSTTVAGVSAVRGAGEAEWGAAGGYGAPLAGGGANLLLERRLGRGMLLLLADASPLQNRLLAVADNAQLGLNLVGPRTRPVVFVESVHGFGQRRGLAALPARWWVAFVALALAGICWVLARGRRLGPAEQTAAQTRPPRDAYLTAVALLLERTRDPGEISAALSRLRDRR